MVALVVPFVVAACHTRRTDKYVPQDVAEVLGVDAPSIQQSIETLVDSGAPPEWVTPERWKRVRALYAAYDNAPLWIEEGGLKDRASALLAALQAAPTHALRTDAYPLDSITRWVNDKRIDSGASASVIANADIVLTAAYVAYASDMLVGQVDPKSVSQSWHIPARPSAVDSALAQTLSDSSMTDGLDAMAPQDSEYVQLRRDYERYRGFVAHGGWAAIEPGVSPEELTARFAAEGDTVPDEDSLMVVLAGWQARHDLEPDGKLGPATRAALDVSAGDRLRQIGANMERHRWLPRALGERYVYVNVPSFRLDAYDSGQRVLSMKVVVGAEYDGHSTPVFSDSMRYVVFRPYWTPTSTILKTEILPKIASDRTYLARNDMEYGVEDGARVLRQRPGPHNSLGLVKFLFPNDYNIYLHDTNEKSLFGKAVRAGSHGCIRLEEPAKLASYVLGWPADSVWAAMNNGRNNRRITLGKKVPVYIVYFTAYERDGNLHFANDVYRRDDALSAHTSAASPER
ncbi:MAG TPA: L,D-transpeptidase family protein [Gemmatimonadaceae bacterium]|nr:L,D-transpeptidase family protein [Gemmatimonadaceae bacterium]